MREHLYRAQRVGGKEWVYGDLVQLYDGRRFIIDNKLGACIDNKGNFINTEFPFVNEVIPETVCEYTGLTDKNGKKIFEGDIITSDDNSTIVKGLVRFADAMFTFDMEYKGEFKKDLAMPLFDDCNVLEIIGTIFDEGD